MPNSLSLSHHFSIDSRNFIIAVLLSVVKNGWDERESSRGAQVSYGDLLWIAILNQQVQVYAFATFFTCSKILYLAFHFTVDSLFCFCISHGRKDRLYVGSNLSTICCMAIWSMAVGMNKTRGAARVPCKPQNCNLIPVNVIRIRNEKKKKRFRRAADISCPRKVEVC